MEHDDMWVSELEQQKDVPGLIEALEHPDEKVRIRAAEALGRVGDEQAIPALTAALADPAATDPADLFRGNSAWEEMGSQELIYRVRDAAWEAQKLIRGKTPLDTTPVESLPGKSPFEVGDIVVQYRIFTQYGLRGEFRDGPASGMEGTRWKVLSITKNEVALELVEGVYREPPHSWGSRHNPGYVVRVSSSDEFRRKFPGTKGKQLAFDTFRKVE
jgi:HEAT repeats